MSAALPFPTTPVLGRDAGAGPLRMGFCVSGGGHLFRAAVRHANVLGIAPRTLVLESKAPPDVEAFARDHGVAVRRLVATRRPALDEELVAAFDDADAELWALTFDRILPPAVVSPRRGRIVNVHMALLPAFAGMHGIRQTLAGGARFGGATLHEVDELMDNGPLIAQCAVALRPGDDEDGAGARIWPLLRATYLQTLAWYAQGRVERDESGRLWVRGAEYGSLPVNPRIELPDLD